MNDFISPEYYQTISSSEQVGSYVPPEVINTGGFASSPMTFPQLSTTSTYPTLTNSVIPPPPRQEKVNSEKPRSVVVPEEQGKKWYETSNGIFWLILSSSAFVVIVLMFMILFSQK